MKRKHNSLGRGLSNLLPNAADLKEQNNPAHAYQEIRISEIQLNPKQPRKYFEEKELSKLAETIKNIGLLEPVILRELGRKRYELIAGERRFRAAKMIGLRKIPAILKQADDLQALEMGIIENIQREELNPVEEAQIYEKWMKTTKQKPDVLSKKVGKDRTTIRNLTRILKLPKEVLGMVEKKQLTVGQARPLLNINDQNQLKQLAQKIVEMQWSARRVEEEVGNLTETEVYRKPKKKKDPNITHTESELGKTLSSRVRIEQKKNGSGKLIIHYGSLQDFDRLLELLTGTA